jgi:CheY-like chemotaxis protein
MNDSSRIIIAEDDVSLSNVLTRLILRKRPNAIVNAFENGHEALAGYIATGADLVFCNHSMPGMDGPTLIRTVRARGDTVPIIGISGDPFLHDDYLAAGATEFVGGGEVITQLPRLLQQFLPPEA